MLCSRNVWFMVLLRLWSALARTVSPCQLDHSSKCHSAVRPLNCLKVHGYWCARMFFRRRASSYKAARRLFIVAAGLLLTCAFCCRHCDLLRRNWGINCSNLALKMASGETIRWSYECSPLLGIFLCVKNAEPCWRLDKLSQSFSAIFHNSFTLHKIREGSLGKGFGSRFLPRNGCCGSNKPS